MLRLQPHKQRSAVVRTCLCWAAHSRAQRNSYLWLQDTRHIYAHHMWSLHLMKLQRGEYSALLGDGGESPGMLRGVRFTKQQTEHTVNIAWRWRIDANRSWACYRPPPREWATHFARLRARAASQFLRFREMLPPEAQFLASQCPAAEQQTQTLGCSPGSVECRAG